MVTKKDRIQFRGTDVERVVMTIEVSFDTFDSYAESHHEVLEKCNELASADVKETVVIVKGATK